jgi:predicted metal-dependent enzyme (double-stranded beta helix superfamily)
MAGMTISPEGKLRWDHFLAQMVALANDPSPETELLDRGEAALAALVAVDDWLPDPFAVPDPQRYQQHLLHRDPAGRLSVVSFVWGPGQATPIHDHTVWGLVGVLRGSEASQRYTRDGDGLLRAAGTAQVLLPGDIDRLSPTEGDIHQVTNVDNDVSISIHVYGADIGAVKRHSFDADGGVRTFISGYSESAAPADWTGHRE